MPHLLLCLMLVWGWASLHQWWWVMNHLLRSRGGCYGWTNTRARIYYSASCKSHILYSGKVWWGESLVNWASRSFGEEKFGECRWFTGRRAGLSGFNWRMTCNFAKFSNFAKLFPHQTFPLYGTLLCVHFACAHTACACAWVFVCVHIWIYVHVCVCTHTCMHVWTYICMCICVCVFVRAGTKLLNVSNGRQI